MKPDKTQKIAAIYCRVSTHEQGKGDFSSLDSQEALLKQYCIQQGWTVYSVYADTKTGTTLDRDEMTRMLKDAEAGKFNIIVITKLDRISRSIKDFLDLDERLRVLDVDIVVTTQHIDTTTPAGKMQRNIMLTFGEFERDMIADRTREKLYSQAQQGHWGGGLVLLGYDVVDKKLIINKEEATLVRRIFQYYIEDPSSNKVALRLNNEGYKTKIRKSKDQKVSGGGSFNNQNIQLILKNKIYTGIITSKDEEFKGLHEPIIDQDTFNVVQKEMIKSRTNSMVTFEGSDLLLLGITTCGICGKNLTTTYGRGRNGERYYYYKCSSKTKFGTAKCEASDLPADKLEEFVENVILHIGSDDRFFNAVFAQMSNNENAELIKMREKLEELKRNRGLNEKQCDKLVDYISAADSDVPTAIISEKLKKFAAERSMITDQIVDLERKIDVITTYDISKDELRNRYNKLGEVYKNLSFERKKKLAKVTINRIESFLKKKESKGLLRFDFRGDGKLDVDWEIKKAPETQVSSAFIGWLRG